ncbi:SEA (Seh1-associated) complex subunit [Tieghemiomyces parasiticus]|uniref:SEA (Seh1-associated) complex subunit n=1 Tax=Tieghemiomyces parasiticus TaxID=78921 RepID=A0A9W8AGL7_9FUNG|nr:SEA (Seh1-associated) complex subunit [Tieghemiomyces parasiticus]
MSFNPFRAFAHPIEYTLHKEIVAISAAPPGNNNLAVVGNDLSCVLRFDNCEVSQKITLKSNTVGVSFSKFTQVCWCGSESDRRVIGCTASGSVYCWDPLNEGSKPIAFKKEPSRINQIVAYGTDPNCFLTAGSDGTIKLWVRLNMECGIFVNANRLARRKPPGPATRNDVRDFDSGGSVRYKKHAQFFNMQCNPHNAWDVVAAEEEGNIVRLDMRSKAFVDRALAHAQGVKSMHWNPAGRWLATAGNDKLIMAWDLQSPGFSGIQKTVQTHGSLKSVRWRPDHPDELASSHSLHDGRVYLWNLNRPGLARAFIRSPTPVVDFVFRDPSVIWAACEEGVVRQLDFRSAAIMEDLFPRSRVRWSPSGELAFTTCRRPGRNLVQQAQRPAPFAFPRVEPNYNAWQQPLSLAPGTLPSSDPATGSHPDGYVSSASAVLAGTIPSGDFDAIEALTMTSGLTRNVITSAAPRTTGSHLTQALAHDTGPYLTTAPESYGSRLSATSPRPHNSFPPLADPARDDPPAEVDRHRLPPRGDHSVHRGLLDARRINELLSTGIEAILSPTVARPTQHMGLFRTSAQNYHFDPFAFAHLARNYIHDPATPLLCCQRNAMAAVQTGNFRASSTWNIMAMIFESADLLPFGRELQQHPAAAHQIPYYPPDHLARRHTTDAEVKEWVPAVLHYAARPAALHLPTPRLPARRDHKGTPTPRSSQFPADGTSPGPAAAATPSPGAMSLATMLPWSDPFAIATPPGSARPITSLLAPMDHLTTTDTLQSSTVTDPADGNYPLANPVGILLRTIEFYATAGDVQMCVTLYFVFCEVVRPHLDLILVSHWCSEYVELLRRFQLHAIATEVGNRSEFPFLKKPTTQHSEIATSCGACGEILLFSDAGYWTCGSCHGFANRCVLCNLPVRGHVVWCRGCGHGGHAGHLTNWFRQQTQCPSGCGHECKNLTPDMVP